MIPPISQTWDVHVMEWKSLPRGKGILPRHGQQEDFLLQHFQMLLPLLFCFLHLLKELELLLKTCSAQTFSVFKNLSFVLIDGRQDDRTQEESDDEDCCTNPALTLSVLSSKMQVAKKDSSKDDEL